MELRHYFSVNPLDIGPCPLEWTPWEGGLWPPGANASRTAARPIPAPVPVGNHADPGLVMGHNPAATHRADLSVRLHLPDEREVSRDSMTFAVAQPYDRVQLRPAGQSCTLSPTPFPTLPVGDLPTNVISSVSTLSDPKRRKGVHFVAEPRALDSPAETAEPHRPITAFSPMTCLTCQV